MGVPGHRRWVQFGQAIENGKYINGKKDVVTTHNKRLSYGHSGLDLAAHGDRRERKNNSGCNWDWRMCCRRRRGGGRGSSSRVLTGPVRRMSLVGVALVGSREREKKERANAVEAAREELNLIVNGGGDEERGRVTITSAP